MSLRLALSLVAAFAAAPGVGSGQAPAVARTTSPAATFAARPSAEAVYRVLPAGADLAAGETLVALPGASLEAKGGSVAVTCLADYDGRSPLPILETAVVLNEAKEVDFDLTLDRGRIDVANTKAEGKALVRVRFAGESWVIGLDAPGSRVALELCGRWPAGARFKPPAADAPATPTPADGPTAALVLLVLKGTADVNVGGFTVGLRAPPGPALVRWDNVAGARPQPQKLDALPDWADPAAALSADGRKVRDAVEKFRDRRAADPVAAVDALLASADPVEQRVGLVTLGATDDLPRLGKELAAARTPEAWDFGVTVLRHWLGRGPGQDTRLYDAFRSEGGFTPAQARTAVQLLIGYGPDDLKQPETFEVLIDYLAHDKAAVRNLAAWHLARAVAKDKAVPFAPTATPADGEKLQRAWRQVIPTGTVPGR